jgi:hypothetical protein
LQATQIVSMHPAATSATFETPSTGCFPATWSEQCQPQTCCCMPTVTAAHDNSVSAPLHTHTTGQCLACMSLAQQVRHVQALLGLPSLTSQYRIKITACWRVRTCKFRHASAHQNTWWLACCCGGALRPE